MSNEIGSLNDSQRAAVMWNEGPLLVLAGPGSGKTRVLTLRIARLLSESAGKRFRILGLTFTNKAAAEMRTRVDELIGDQTGRALLTTFHSFSADILRQHGNHVGLRPDFVILTQDEDREGALSDAITMLSEQSDDYSQDDIKFLPAIDRLLAECVPVEKAIDFFRDRDVGRRVQQLYRAYRRVLIEGNRLDFNSLLLVTHELLAGRPAVAKQIRTIYSHICVDEFQDTNLAQYRILRALVGDKPRNLFVVADDDQIIYQWNGASPERLEALRSDFGMDVVQLPANYRCPPEVIECANKLIQHNLERSPGKKAIVAVRSSSGQRDIVRLLGFPDEATEASWIASDILKTHASHPEKCVILARTKRLLDIIAKSLSVAGLKPSLTVRKSEFDARGPIGWLHASLRLANARADREQLRRMCKSFYELEGVSLELRDLVALGEAYGGDYLRAFAQGVLARPEIELGTRQFVEGMEKYLGEKLDFVRFIKEAFKWFDAKENAIAGQGSEGFTDYREERLAWEQIQTDVVKKFGSDDLTLNVFLQELDLVEKSPPIPSDAIRCLTIHSAKGLEWEHVYIAGLAEDQLPSFQSIKKGADSREMQEERRNCFVAVTRAQSSLTLTFAERYSGWPKEPSRFLREMELLPQHCAPTELGLCD
jgi:DNA helicase-2/ATP-dependent DNA helicase PcrA